MIDRRHVRLSTEDFGLLRALVAARQVNPRWSPLKAECFLLHSRPRLLPTSTVANLFLQHSLPRHCHLLPLFAVAQAFATRSSAGPTAQPPRFEPQEGQLCCCYYSRRYRPIPELEQDLKVRLGSVSQAIHYSFEVVLPNVRRLPRSGFSRS